MRNSLKAGLLSVVLSSLPVLTSAQTYHFPNPVYCSSVTNVTDSITNIVDSVTTIVDEMEVITPGFTNITPSVTNIVDVCATNTLPYISSLAFSEVISPLGKTNRVADVKLSNISPGTSYTLQSRTYNTDISNPNQGYSWVDLSTQMANTTNLNYRVGINPTKESQYFRAKENQSPYLREQNEQN